MNEQVNNQVIAKSDPIANARARTKLLVLVASSLVLTFCFVFGSPGLVVGRGFLFNDNGFYLFAIEAVLQGKMVFRDFAWQYGPLPLYVYAGVASVFGNSAETYLITYGAILAIDVGLAFILLKKLMPERAAFFCGLLVVLPGLWKLGGGLLLYLPFEIGLLLGLAIVIRTPAERGVREAASAGVLLGLMQYVKFGGAFVAGLAIVLVDLMALYARGCDRVKAWNWLKRSLVTLGAFLVMEMIRCLAVFILMPGPIAKDVIWPSYMLEHYRDPAIVSERWPAYETLGILLGTQLPGVVWLGLTAAGVFRFLRPGGSGKSGGTELQPVAFIGLFYAVGLVLYFKHKWLIYYYLSVLCVPACWMLWMASKNVRIILFALLLPALLALPIKVTGLQKSGTAPVTMPNGQTLWFLPEDRNRFLMTLAALESVPDSAAARARGVHDPVIVLNTYSGGWHFYGKYPFVGRHVWFLPKFLRPYEEDATFDRVSGCKAIVLFTFADDVKQMTADPMTWNIAGWSPFSRSKDAALLAQLEAPNKIDSRWVVFPIKKRQPSK